MLNTNLLSDASKACLNNAKQYVKDAKILYSTKSYGHALALTVLGEIELGKAIIYHVWSKGLISEKILPNQFLSYFKEDNFEKFASETWWVGSVLAANVEFLVPNIINLVNYKGAIRKGVTSKLTQETKDEMAYLIEEIKPQNKKIDNLLKFACQGLFVRCSLKKREVISPAVVNKQLVKERIADINERIVNGEPFLMLSFSEVQKEIAQGLLSAAFESIIPIKSEIKQLIMPLKTC